MIALCVGGPCDGARVEVEGAPPEIHVTMREKMPPPDTRNLKTRPVVLPEKNKARYVRQWWYCEDHGHVPLYVPTMPDGSQQPARVTLEKLIAGYKP